MGLIKHQVLYTVILDLEENTGKIHNLRFRFFYYFPVASKLLIGPQKWFYYRGEAKFGQEGTYLKVMFKYSALVWNNGISQQTILHVLRCAIPDFSINQGQKRLTKFCSIFAEIFRESDQIHT